MVRARWFKIVMMTLVFVSQAAFADDDEAKIEMKQTGPQVRVIKTTRKVEYIAMRGGARIDRQQQLLDAKLERRANAANAKRARYANQRSLASER